MHRQTATTVASLFTTALVALALTLGSSASADVAPPNKRGVKYTLTIENLDQHSGHVFIAFPTSNLGYGYVLEKGVGITNVLTRKSWKGENSALHAMTRKDFDAYEPNPARHPHGDKNEEVSVVRQPPGPPQSLAAAVTIEPPDLVPNHSPVVAIERVFRIVTLDDKVFELQLVKEITTQKGGKKTERRR